MKKISIVLVICLIALMCLSACSSTANTDPEETDAVQTEPVSTDDAQESEQPTELDTAYTVEIVGEKDTNENGEVIGDCHFQKVVFTNPNAALTKINEELAEAADDFFDEGMGKQYDEYLSELPESMKPGLVDYPYTATYDVESVYIDDDYVCVNYVWNWYAGGVNNYGSTAFCFDIKTGDDIDFEDLFASEADARTAFSNAVNALIDANPEDFFEDAKETVSNYDLDNVKFSLSGDKIVVFIDQYEIAPGASGAFTVDIAR